MLLKAEQETVIRWDRESAIMEVYTADPTLLRRLSGLSAYTVKQEYRNGGRIVAKTFEADRRLLTLRSKRPTFTKEQRERAREQLAKINSEPKTVQ